MEVPANLITTSWNLMQLHNKPSAVTANPTAISAVYQATPPTSNTSHTNTGTSSTTANTVTGTSSTTANTVTGSYSDDNPISGHRVYTRHMQLQDKLLKVRIDASISADGLAVENEYSKEVGQTEMNRYRALNSCPSQAVKSTINVYYDKERMKLADNTEKKLDSLIHKAEALRQAAYKANSDRGAHTVNIPCDTAVQGRLPSLQDQTSQGRQSESQEQSAAAGGQGASLLLQPVEDGDCKMTAVRQLKFNMEDQDQEGDEDNDYLNGSVNSEDFEIDEIDVETVDKEEQVNGDIISGDMVNTSVSSVDNSVPSKAVMSPVAGRVSSVIAGSPVCSSIDEASNSSSDILQQCIAESGLDMVHTDQHVNTSSNSSITAEARCRDTQCDSITTTAHITDNIAPYNTTVSSPHVDTTYSAHTNYMDNKTVPVTPLLQKTFSFSADMFGTPHNQSLGHKFTSPDQISMALSEIGKLCGGPSVTFTPELRREITASSLTPNSTGLSPFIGLNNSTGFSSSTSQPAWKTSPMDSTHKSGYTSGSGQKRKRSSIEDEAEHQYLHGDGHMTSNDTSTTHSEVSSATGPQDDDTSNNNNTAMFRTHRMLTGEATTVLNHWYSNHVQYPYPNDEEVKHLAQLTGITGRQVKKWMANKRVRCFNTLSITGNQHPIKFKYNGRGRKKKTVTEKENCDSTTQDKARINYSLLSEDAKATLNSWYDQHQDNPYPSEDEKQQLASACSITVSQVKSWFANKRNRTNNTRRQVPNYFINKFPEYSNMVQYVGQRREEARMIKKRKLNQMNMYIQPNFYF